MSETKSLTARLPVEKFKHSNMTMSRADKWEEFKTSLKSAFGQVFPLLAQQLDHKCDPTKEVWGLPWGVRKFSALTGDAQISLLREFTQAQYALHLTLNENFGTHEKNIIQKHEPSTLTEKLKADRKWKDDDKRVVWLPFGYLCLHEIEQKYTETGVTNALTKYAVFNEAKAFKPSDVPQWASKLEHAWAEYYNSIENLSHMAAIDTLHQILDSGHDGWNQWAVQFSLKQGSKPYDLQTLIDKVISHEKFISTSGKRKTAGAQAMLAAKPNNKFNAKGVCARRNCTRKVSQPHRQFCDACFIPNFKSKRASDKVLANVPQKVRFDTRDKKREQFKKKLAQLNNKRRDMDKEAFLSEAMACIADAWDDDADDGDSAVGDAPKKKKKKKKKPAASAEAHVAVAPATDHDAEALAAIPHKLPVPKKGLALKKSKSKSVIKKLPGRTGITFSRKAAKKVKKGKVPTALLASALKDCESYRFAGSALPPFFKKK